MRLIDADKIVFTNCLVKSGLKVCCHNEGIVPKENIDMQPTVKAIPIEWLHSIMEKQLIFAMNNEMEGTTTVKDGVIHCVSGALACQVLANVIKLWKKEHEAN